MRKAQTKKTKLAGPAKRVSALVADALVVVPLRLAKIARGGPAGKKEAKLMVTEKVAAAVQLQRALVTGGLGRDPRKVADKILTHLGRKVRANRKRLGG